MTMLDGTQLDHNISPSNCLPTASLEGETILEPNNNTDMLIPAASSSEEIILQEGCDCFVCQWILTVQPEPWESDEMNRVEEHNPQDATEQGLMTQYFLLVMNAAAGVPGALESAWELEFYLQNNNML
ncbi:hypothetical protein AJ80_09950 [Polytolypa hystricis UAMH7299]|uniref:Uncharacterized protein n=1 Tax=Polytolypa hystricis (strain UAMH7299) TaxID=1447883 RepID=A0A2B7WG12_POLH7|nr:hypothetical protein AJ80_09950 [Polytolypa hystricis UAMH7299]